METLMQSLSWGEAAFAQAKQAQKPIFLWIGCPGEAPRYGAETLALLREQYIAIAVEGEKRPDVAAVYRAACRAMTGRESSPICALLTPGGQPFYAAPSPPEAELTAALQEGAEQWTHRREKTLRMAAELTKAISQEFQAAPAPIQLDARLLRGAMRAYAAAFDGQWGGLGIAGKQFMPQALLCLLRHGTLAEDARALDMALLTLRRMCEGSVFDHVGGGFLHGAEDRTWGSPKPEKHLLDNALLARAYFEAWQRTHRPLYRNVAERTLHYAMRELADEAGGFYAIERDESEGAYYRLSRPEIVSLLGRDDGAAYCYYYNIDQDGIPQRIGHDGGIETMRMAALNETVRAYRAERRPLKREALMLTADNAQMIATLAYAYQCTGDAAYLNAAVRCALFLHAKMTDANGHLYGHWDGRAAGQGSLRDYAALAQAALSLYRATLEDRWLTWAVHLSRAMLARFEDRQRGGFFLTPHDGEALIARPKETMDGDAPSSNAMALAVLAELAALDIGEGWAEAAKRQALFLSGWMADAPLAHMGALAAALPLLHTPTLLTAYATPLEHEALLGALRDAYRPLLFIKAAPPGAAGSSWRLKGRGGMPPLLSLSAVIDALRADGNFAMQPENATAIFTIPTRLFTK
ncbi:MAG: DUF255 domain-containing protein [Oscillospiraceae bacterium]|jgi:uncharacterized protein YyaL (SSP411 family)|nr:DUF255 domain-containing protein [Oscillospiraceae bacterium]